MDMCLGIRPVIIRSKDEVDINKWTKISISRRHGEGTLRVGDAEPVTGKAIGPARTMYLKTHLYIGGYDKRILLNKGVEVNRGFDGCVSGVSYFTMVKVSWQKRVKKYFLMKKKILFQLEVASQKIDMIKSILDGANIQNCGDSNEISVS